MDKQKIAFECKKHDLEYEIIMEYNQMVHDDYVKSGYFNAPTSDFSYDIEEISACVETINENKNKLMNVCKLKALIKKYTNFISLLK